MFKDDDSELNNHSMMLLKGYGQSVGDGKSLFEETFELKVIQSRITYWIFDFTRPLTHSVTKEIFHVTRKK